LRAAPVHQVQHYGFPMTNGRKQFLGWLFMVLAIAAWLAYILFDYWFAPTVQLASTAAAFTMFKMAANDKTS
jgi:hypothetical protein